MIKEWGAGVIKEWDSFGVMIGVSAIKDGRKHGKTIRYFENF
jgi:antitoxin component YwqK of YwqJK toxin-antitoxin module